MYIMDIFLVNIRKGRVLMIKCFDSGIGKEWEIKVLSQRRVYEKNPDFRAKDQSDTVLGPPESWVGQVLSN
jgi:hypothetical protein